MCHKILESIVLEFSSEEVSVEIHEINQSKPHGHEKNKNLSLLAWKEFYIPIMRNLPIKVYLCIGKRLFFLPQASLSPSPQAEESMKDVIVSKNIFYIVMMRAQNYLPVTKQRRPVLDLSQNTER